ncbi:6-hydroxymethylpterin diphosphokinase MptE-like protein [Spirochaetia bacterium 38H-sp]|uniref:6-hydroxymethylpterin diphosphokinase MptE-like protein n=1 Tax=Rarispira pelagica TaxID=3141764 RepID=A0ABU9UD42_9SPIR
MQETSTDRENLKKKNLNIFSHLIHRFIDIGKNRKRGDIILREDKGRYFLELDGKAVYSKYSPDKEAARLIKEANLEKADVCVFFGLGGGYHVEEFLNRNRTADAIIIEPLFENLYEIAGLRDFSFLMQGERVSFFTYDMLDEKSFFSVILSYPDSGIYFFSLNAYKNYYQDKYKHIFNLTERIKKARNTNRNTAKKFGRRWIRNTLRNLPLFIDAHGLELLSGRLAYPAILLGAGPSLDLLSPHISMLRERTFIIATDTSIRWCRQNGVIPDIVITVDPQYWNSRHLDYVDKSNCLLVTDPAVYPSVLHKEGLSALFINSALPLVSFFSRWTGFKMSLAAGGSVTTSAWDLARLCGADIIMMAGVDLGFPQRRLYYKGALVEEYSLVKSSRLRSPHDNIIPVYFDAGLRREKCDTGYTYTNSRMEVYKTWFEIEVGKTVFPRTVRISKGGVDIKGIEYISPPEMSNLPYIRDNIDNILKDIRDAALIKKNMQKSSQVFYILKELIQDISDKAQKGLEITRDINITQDTFTKIEAIIFDIKRNPVFPLINLLIQDVVDNLIDARTEDSVIKNYAVILKAIEDSTHIYMEEIDYVSPLYK